MLSAGIVRKGATATPPLLGTVSGQLVVTQTFATAAPNMGDCTQATPGGSDRTILVPKSWEPSRADSESQIFPRGDDSNEQAGVTATDLTTQGQLSRMGHGSLPAVIGHVASYALTVLHVRRSTDRSSRQFLVTSFQFLVLWSAVSGHRAPGTGHRAPGTGQRAKSPPRELPVTGQRSPGSGNWAAVFTGHRSLVGFFNSPIPGH
jgi:hypothetical protein